MSACTSHARAWFRNMHFELIVIEHWLIRAGLFDNSVALYPEQAANSRRSVRRQAGITREITPIFSVPEIHKAGEQDWTGTNQDRSAEKPDGSRSSLQGAEQTRIASRSWHGKWSYCAIKTPVAWGVYHAAITKTEHGSCLRTGRCIGTSSSNQWALSSRGVVGDGVAAVSHQDGD
jgi:hypothetical protein